MHAGAVQRMVLHFIAAGRLSGRFRRSGSLCAASRGGGGEPAGRIPVFLSFRTEGFPNSLRTISGEVSGRFAVCLSAQWRALLFVLFLVYPHVLLDAPQSAACERCIAEQQEKLLFAHCEPLPIRNRQRVEQGIEMRRAVHGGFLVVGTAALAAIAAEDPSVEVGQGAVGLLFDRTTGDAAVRVDHLGRDDGSRWTTVQAVPAAAATGSCERGIVLVGRQGKYQLAQQDIGAVLGREQQGLPPDPAQTRFDGQLFFQQRSRIDERAAREPGVLPAQGFEHRAQHPLEDGVVVAAAGVGGDFCAAPGRIAFAQRVLVAHGADHDRLRPFDQVSDVETFVEVAFEVFQRGTVAFGEPFAEVGFVLRKMLAGRDSAEVEACILGKFFDVLTRDHGDNSAQK